MIRVSGANKFVLSRLSFFSSVVSIIINLKVSLSFFYTRLLIASTIIEKYRQEEGGQRKKERKKKREKKILFNGLWWSHLPQFGCLGMIQESLIAVLVSKKEPSLPEKDQEENPTNKTRQAEPI